MSGLFGNLSIKQFNLKFSDENKCLQYLADLKWKDGFVCRKCGHVNYCKGKTPFSRRCTKCKHDESATSHTVFHKCKIPLTEAFQIAFYVCKNPDISTYEISHRINIRQMTCWKFKKKIIECIEKGGGMDFYENDNR
jgi:hypothetical protein